MRSLLVFLCLALCIGTAFSANFSDWSGETELTYNYYIDSSGYESGKHSFTESFIRKSPTMNQYLDQIIYKVSPKVIYDEEKIPIRDGLYKIKTTLYNYNGSKLEVEVFNSKGIKIHKDSVSCELDSGDRRINIPSGRQTNDLSDSNSYTFSFVEPISKEKVYITVRLDFWVFLSQKEEYPSGASWSPGAKPVMRQSGYGKLEAKVDVSYQKPYLYGCIKDSLLFRIFDENNDGNYDGGDRVRVVYQKSYLETNEKVVAFGQTITLSNDDPQQYRIELINPPKYNQIIGLSNIKSIVAGYGYQLALAKDGTVWSWGRQNDSGQLGDGTFNHSLTPVRVKDLDNVVAVAAGNRHSIALKQDGTVWAWGEGCKAIGSKEKKLTTPVMIKNLTDVKAIAAGAYYSAALRNDGTVWVWGGGLGSSTRKIEMIKDLSDIIAISAGNDRLLALKKDGALWGSFKQSKSFPISGLENLTAVFCGSTHSSGDQAFAIKKEGTTWAFKWEKPTWPWDKTPEKIEPLQIEFPVTTQMVCFGSDHYLTLMKDGSVWAWGDNEFGQLGDGTGNRSKTPLMVEGMSNVTSIMASGRSSMVVKEDGTVWQLGGKRRSIRVTKVNP